MRGGKELALTALFALTSGQAFALPFQLARCRHGCRVVYWVSFVNRVMGS